jgi:hypothetical protein
MLAANADSVNYNIVYQDQEYQVDVDRVACETLKLAQLEFGIW